MYHKIRVKIHKHWVITLALPAFLTGCEADLQSVEIPTKEIFADYTVDANETGNSSVNAWYYKEKKQNTSQPLDNLNYFNRIDLELSEGESSEVDVNNRSYLMDSWKEQMTELKSDPRTFYMFTTSFVLYTLSEMSINVFGSQLQATTPALATQDEVKLSFFRASGEIVQSSARVGEFPVLTLPAEGATISRTANEFTVAWNALSNSQAPLNLTVGVRCSHDFTWTEDDYVELEELAYDVDHHHTGDVSVDLPGGSTSYVISRAALMKDVVVPDGVTVCGGTVSLSYTSRGVLAPDFKGGKVEVRHNARKVSFLFRL